MKNTMLMSYSIDVISACYCHLDKKISFNLQSAQCVVGHVEVFYLSSTPFVNLCFRWMVFFFHTHSRMANAQFVHIVGYSFQSNSRNHWLREKHLMIVSKKVPE